MGAVQNYRRPTRPPRQQVRLQYRQACRDAVDGGISRCRNPGMTLGASTCCKLLTDIPGYNQRVFSLEDICVGIQVMFAALLGELVFLWSYRWLPGTGGFFLNGENRGVGRRVSPRVRLMKLAGFSVLFLQKLETLRTEHKTMSMMTPSEKRGREARSCSRGLWQLWVAHWQRPSSWCRLGYVSIACCLCHAGVFYTQYKATLPPCFVATDQLLLL